MKNVQLTSRLLLPVLFLVFSITGCATKLSKPTSAPTPAKVKLSEFARVEMKAVTISEKFAGAAANQKAKNKIEEVLFNNMHMVFGDLTRIEPGSDFTQTDVRTLQITPVIKEIKFISGGARFMVGAMAGSSAVLMQVTLRDSATGEIIANPEFYRDASAYAGGWSIGASDNKMLEEIANDIVNYCSMNR